MRETWHMLWYFSWEICNWGSLDFKGRKCFGLVKRHDRCHSLSATEVFAIVAKQSMQVLCKHVCCRFENRHFLLYIRFYCKFSFLQSMFTTFIFQCRMKTLSFLSWSCSGNGIYLFLSPLTPWGLYKFHIFHFYNLVTPSAKDLFLICHSFVCQLTRMTSSNLSRGFCCHKTYSSIQS